MFLEFTILFVIIIILELTLKHDLSRVWITLWAWYTVLSSQTRVTLHFRIAFNAQPFSMVVQSLLVGISWLSHGYLVGISRVSRRYLIGFSWISHGYLRHISGISQAYLMGISGISQAYLRHISDISQAYFRRISGISQSYLKHISGIS